jgi:hypothetical protein
LQILGISVFKGGEALDFVFVAEGTAVAVAVYGGYELRGAPFEFVFELLPIWS